MNPLLQQFLVEARDLLEQVGQKLLALEEFPGDEAIIGEIFRLIHTLKGNSGLFDMPSLTGVVHAAEDLLDCVRDGRLGIAAELIDALLEAMDFVGQLLDEVEDKGSIPADYARESAAIALGLRERLPERMTGGGDAAQDEEMLAEPPADWLWLSAIPDAERLPAFDALVGAGGTATALRYRPEENCFFKGEDPAQLIRTIPGLLTFTVSAATPWPEASMFDVYRCNLVFDAISTAGREEIENHVRYVRQQVALYALPAVALALPPKGGSEAEGAGIVAQVFLAEARRMLAEGDMAGLRNAATTALDMINPDLSEAAALSWIERLTANGHDAQTMAPLIERLSGGGLPDWRAIATQSQAAHVSKADQARPAASSPRPPRLSGPFRDIAAAQTTMLALPASPREMAGRLRAARNAVAALLSAAGQDDSIAALDLATETSVEAGDAGALTAFIETELLAERRAPAPHLLQTIDPPSIVPGIEALEASLPQAETVLLEMAAFGEAPPDPARGLYEPASDADVRSVRARGADPAGERGVRVLKVPQEKVDRLMDLIGEMVVAKNALPYLAVRAEDFFGSRELGREIKAQYTIINRIAEEMQDGIMQVRMLPVGAVFQRFPRLVRDVARQLGKVVKLVVEGEETEADKNIVESLADPMIHILRNSLDHGLETPDARRAMGKPEEGRLTVRASQEGDRVLIEVEDDGKGIDPAIIKRKAFEKGLIDEQRLEALSDADAIQLVFAAGFSTAEQVSNLSGRGVGMDVVKSSLEKVGGQVRLTSEKGRGTRIQLSLPLSMSVSNVMMVHIAGQQYGVPMEAVVETVRVAGGDIHLFKDQRTAVLRGRIVPLYGANDLLRTGTAAEPNDDGEYAVLVARVGGQTVGIVVDGFAQTIDVILKPLEGPLAHLPGFSGSALLGDGSVLLVLNLKELI